MSLQPTCILCLSACDAASFLTSCEHFFCGRCAKRLLQGAPSVGGNSCSPLSLPAPCPICRKPGVQLLSLTHRSIRPLFQDPTELMQQSNRMVSAQLRHYRQIHQRMMEALKVLNTKYQGMERALKDTKRELQDTKATLRTVQQFTQKQNKEIDELSRAASQKGLQPHGREEGSSAAPRLSPSLSSRRPSEDPEWVSMLMRGGSCAGDTAHAFPRTHSASQIPLNSSPASFSALGWAATSGVLKRSRDDETARAVQASARDSRSAAHAPSPDDAAATPRSHPSMSDTTNSPAPNPPLSGRSFNSYQDATCRNTISAPSPLRGLLRSSVLKK